MRRQGIRQEETEDLTQGFFALFLERKDLNAIRREKRATSFVFARVVKHFLADERRRAMAVKRGKGRRPIPLEELRDSERIGPERS